MKDLNSTPREIVAGVRFMTIRSDTNDKYAQPDGRFIGLPNVATGLGYDAPELKGATNIVLAGVDHRETGYGPAAFEAMYRFITGGEPKTLDIVKDTQVALNGKISGFESGKDDGPAGAVIYMSRPRGYFGVGRDTILPDGSPPPGITPGVPSESSARLAFPADLQRSVVGRFNDEQIAALTWPRQDNHVSVIELTY